MNTEALKKNLEQKTIDVIEKGGGSTLVQAFTDAKQACSNAGVSDEEIVEIVNAATQGVKR
jgi:hypothetical protein